MKKVITYGTYDLFHQGHYNILKRAKEYGDYLIVGVTGDSYDIGRGKLSVKDSLATRIENVKNTGLVDEIIVEEYLGQKISDIIKYDIDTFVIGDDWKGKFDHLSKYCEMVYLERTKNISSTKLREENFDKYRIGIITDQNDDNQIVKEAKLVSGFEVVSVYSDDIECAKKMQEKYDLEKACDDLQDFYNDVQIVYIRAELKKRYALIKKSLEAGKHVICDVPFTLDADKQTELSEMAIGKNLILINNIKLVYIQVFIQLLWMVQSGLIGEVIRLECSVSKNDKNVPYLFYELLAMSVCPILKIMGSDYDDFNYKLIKKNNIVEFGTINLKYDTAEAVINVGNTIRVDNKIEIIGTEGTITMRDNWWRANYFELEKTDGSEKQVYNVNFEGNGFKFLIREMLQMLQNDRVTSKTLSVEDVENIIKILQAVSKA